MPATWPRHAVKNESGEAELDFENDMSSVFILVALKADLDGVPIFSEDDTNGGDPHATDKLDDVKRRRVYAGQLAPGGHRFAVTATWIGRCGGIYDYCRAMRFDVRDARDVEVRVGEKTTATAVGYEKGSVTTPIEERPAVRFEGG